MRRLLLAPLLVAATAAPGCGSSSSGTSAAPAAPTTVSPSSAPAASSSGKTVAIGMKGLKFTAPDVKVKLGQTVTWTNLEEIAHNVVAESGADFQSSTFGKGKTFAFTPKRAGTVKYVCTIHPGMEGTLSVEG